MKKPKLPARVLPPKFTNIMEVSFHKTFTFRERLRILIGFNAQVGMKCHLEHSCGKFTPELHFELTDIVKPTPTNPN